GVGRHAAGAVEHEAGEAGAGGVEVEGVAGFAAPADLPAVAAGEGAAVVGGRPEALPRHDHVDVAGGRIDGDAGRDAGPVDLLVLGVQGLDDRVGDVDP